MEIFTAAEKPRNPDKSSGWRVVLFRALKEGNLGTVVKIAESKPTAIHERFTTGMHEWELEWESPRWNELREATCLFVACAYTQAPIVEFLLDACVDIRTKCGFGQTAWDVIGYFNGSDAKVTKVKALLGGTKRPMRPPIAPKVDAKISYQENFHISYESTSNIPASANDQTLLTTERDPETSGDMTSSSIKVPKRVSEVITVCKAVIQWQCYWLPPGASSELRYRNLDEQEDEWNSERMNVWKKTLTGLRPGEEYAFQVRTVADGGAARFSDWGEATCIRMPYAKHQQANKVEEEEAAGSPPPSRNIGSMYNGL